MEAREEQMSHFLFSGHPADDPSFASLFLWRAGHHSIDYATFVRTWERLAELQVRHHSLHF
jgi:hypothetical protein